VWSPADEVSRVLVTCAHPDDADFGCAGTVAVLVDHGVDVAYCIATRGEAGGSDRSQPRSEMAEIRQREQRAAAAAVGVSNLTFLGHPDGQVAATQELRRDFARVIRQFRPDVVISQSPERRWDIIYASHPDHLATGEAVVAAVYPDSRNPFAHPELLDEGLEPHTVKEIWLMAMPTVGVAVDITDVFERKVAALACHKSQGGDDPAMAELLGGWARGSARAAGLPEGSLAEVFQVVSTA
jgi:LmbE family N-acetylglucosaminyl deacetylase